MPQLDATDNQITDLQKLAIMRANDC